MLIVFDDRISNMKANKKLILLIAELYTAGRKLDILLVFISQSYFKVSKDIRLNMWYEDGSEVPTFQLLNIKYDFLKQS